MLNYKGLHAILYMKNITNEGIKRMYKKEESYQVWKGIMCDVKKAVCLFTLGAGVVLTGSSVHASSVQPAGDTTVAATEAAQDTTGKIVKEDGESYYKNADGKIVKSQFVTIGKKTYYFGKKGTMEKGWVKQGKKYYFFDRNTGVWKKKGTVDGIKLKKDGTATVNKDSKKKIEMMIEAKKIVKEQTKATDSKSQKLKKVFDWVMKHPYKRYRIIAKVRTEKNWEVDYANDIFKKGKGCCVSESSAFAYLAKECGYTKVYLCDDTSHAWVEINGKVYDTLFAETKGYNKYFNSTYKASKLVRVNKLKIG